MRVDSDKLLAELQYLKDTLGTDHPHYIALRRRRVAMASQETKLKILRAHNGR